MTATIKDISDNLGRVFRYILPGAVILGLAYSSNPSWFKGVTLDDWWHLVAAAVVTLVVGNTWFVFHRFAVHQFIDYVFYKREYEGPSQEKTGQRVSYADGLAQFVVVSHKISPDEPIRQHISLRASSMHLMYITSEALFIFAYISSPGSVLQVSFVGFVCTLWQNNLTRRIDWYSVNENLQLAERKTQTDRDAKS